MLHGLDRIGGRQALFRLHSRVRVEMVDLTPDEKGKRAASLLVRYLTRLAG